MMAIVKQNRFSFMERDSEILFPDQGDEHLPCPKNIQFKPNSQLINSESFSNI